MCELDDEEVNIEITAVRAGLGGGFDPASKLKVIKFEEAMNGSDCDKWKEEIKNFDEQNMGTLRRKGFIGES